MASSVDTNLSDFKINSVASEEVLRQMEQAGLLEPNQIYMTPEEDINLSQLRAEVVYDRSSPDSNKNWGITVGIKGGIVTESGDFTRYEYLKVTAWSYDTTITYFIDLRNQTPKEITSGYPYSGSGQVLSSVNITEEHYSFSAVSSDKKKFYHYKAGYIKDTTDNARQENAQYVVTNIEGYLKEPAMIYTGAELHEGNGISIKNGVISARQAYSTEEQLTGEYWIDGKPIYTKVFVITLVNNANLEIPYNISNADTIWVDEGNSFILSSAESLSVSWFYTTSDWYRTWINKNNKVIRFKSPDSFSGRTLYVTLKYTKTS